MKTPNFLGVISIALFLTHFSWSQDQQNEVTNCERRLRIAKMYFPILDQLTIDHKIEILESISPCETTTDLDTQYYIALLHTQIDSEKYPLRTGFSSLEKLSWLDYAPACRTIGILWKKGESPTSIGRYIIDISQADFWFNKSYAKDSISKYAKGYYAMKGFPSPNKQSYSDAIGFFKQSKYAMSKHWLAICHYFGFGVPQDKTKGLQMLSDNAIVNSDNLRKHLLATPFSNPTLSDIENEALESSTRSSSKFYNKEKRSFEGNLIEYDWSGTKIMRKIPIKLSLEQYFSSTANLELDITGKVIEKRVSMKSGTNTFSNGKIEFSLPSLFPDHPNRKQLAYEIDRVSFFEVPVVGSTPFIMARAYGEIHTFRERTPNIVFLLNEVTSNALFAKTDKSTEKNIINDSIDVNLQNSFASISPNPVKNQFNITYQLDSPSRVNIAVYDLLGQKMIEVANDQLLQSGKQIFNVDGSSLSSGSYVVRITIEDQSFIKRIIKL
ncbi:T9SS type A sorting domain-containing protein [Aquimarina sp. 2201CG1-2-11]|uniref:T9SS type A sorting domain-containing protein n=1 Tax=Aquimarina discodermiae TaxID=3231043 RepID=UPI003462DD9D